MPALREMALEAETRVREQQLAEACHQAGIGVTTVRSAQRTADAARRRAVVAWILRTEAGWTNVEIAAALGKTRDGVRRMLRKM